MVPNTVRVKVKEEEEEELEGSAMVVGVSEEMEEGGRMVMGRILAVAFSASPLLLLENVCPPSLDTLIPQCPGANSTGNGQMTRPSPTPPSPPMTASGEEVPINTGFPPPPHFHHPQDTFPPPP